ncbi:GumC family protein [Anthocerotibacter panamensis]|uniref:GumC family protein n=1 Tax=Anthocerotibacter panamensis TaxID=2857077 RepID=UPI001C4078DC|nr:cellulose synthase operon protein YhjQ/BcsQ [Anthocerotibacter panamensis]
MLNLYVPERRSFGERVLLLLNRERKVLLGAFTILLGSSVLAISLLPNTYEAHSKILIESPRTTEELTRGTQVGLSLLQSIGERVNPINTQVELMGSYPLYQKALARLKVSEEEAPYEKLEVKPVLGTDLIEVDYRSGSPALAAKVAASVVTVYTAENLKGNREKVTEARKLLEKQLPGLLTTMRAAQDRLERFQKANRYLGSALESESLTRELNELESKVSAARSEVAFTERKRAALSAQFPAPLSQAINSAGLSQEPGYQELQTQLLQAEGKLAELQSNFGPQNPQVLNAIQRRDQLKTLLKGRVVGILGAKAERFTTALDPLRQRLAEQWFTQEAEHTAQIARLSELTKAQQKLQERARQLPQLNKQQTQLQMTAENAQKEYETFRENYTNSRLAEQLRLSNVRVIEPALVPTEPDAPNRKLLFALALVGSGGIALFLTWLHTRRSDTLEGLIELQDALPIPVLSVVPQLGDGRLVGRERREGDPLIGSYDLLQAHLRMLPREVQTLAVCSWGQDEGCSSVAANLAWLEIQAGRRVLLIDAGGSVPGQMEFWQFNRSVKTSAARFGADTPWQGLLGEVLPGLDILPCGNLHAYKDWLVLLARAREHYDVILLDCPPVSYGPKATLLASLSDGVLWVTCPERLGRRGAQTAAEHLRTWGTRLLGQVVLGSKNPSLPELDPAPALTEAPPPSLPGTLRGENS